MDNVDLQRMRRVMDRLYPGEPSRPEPGPPPSPGRRPPNEGQTAPERTVCGLLDRERVLYGLLWQISRKSGECRRTLQGVIQRSRSRAQRLRTECFLSAGSGAPQPGDMARGREGVVFSLRRAVRLLEELEEDYRRTAGTVPRRREQYDRFSRECRNDERIVERLLEKAVR